MRFTQNLKSFFGSAIKAAQQAPIEILLSLFFFVVFIRGIESEEIFRNLSWSFPFYWALSYACKLLCTGKLRLFYYLALGFPFVFLYYMDTYLEVTRPWTDFYQIIYLLSFLAVLIAKRSQDMRSFAWETYHLGRNLLVSAFFAGLWVGALFSIIYTVYDLFDVERARCLDDIVTYGGMCLLFPLLFLTFEYRVDKRETVRYYELDRDFALKTLVNFIMIPVLLVYMAIFYLYAGKILFTWSLPRGMVATLTLCFLIGALLTKLFRSLLEKPYLPQVFRYLSCLCLPAVGLLWLSIGVRVYQYGMTGTRSYLIAAALVLTLFSIVDWFRFQKKYHVLSVFSFVLFFLLSFAPKINYFELERNKKDRPRITAEVEKRKNEIYVSVAGTSYTGSLEEYASIEYINKWDMGQIENDTLFLKNVAGGLIEAIPTQDILNSVLTEANFEELKKQSPDSIRNYPYVTYYKTDRLLVLFEHLSFRYNTQTQATSISTARVFTILHRR